MDDRVKKIENMLKSRFDMIDSKLDRELKKMKEASSDTKNDSKNDLIILKEANLNVKKQIGSFDDKFAKFAKKVGKHDEQIDDITDTLIAAEKNAKKQVDEFKRFKLSVDDLFLVPGIIGPDKTNNVYTSMVEFISGVHEFKEESAESTVSIMNSKFQTEQKKSGKLVEEMKESLMKILNQQEDELKALKVNIDKLNENMEEMIDDGKEFGDEIVNKLSGRGSSSSSEDDSSSDLIRSHSLSSEEEEKSRVEV